jgi:hypothetical protein
VNKKSMLDLGLGLTLRPEPLFPKDGSDDLVQPLMRASGEKMPNDSIE